MKKLEMRQKQALRNIFNNFNSSYEELLSRLNRTTLSVQRLRSIFGIVYKSVMKQGLRSVSKQFANVLQQSCTRDREFCKTIANVSILNAAKDQSMLVTCLSLTKTVEVEGSFRLFSHILQLETLVL